MKHRVIASLLRLTFFVALLALFPSKGLTAERTAGPPAPPVQSMPADLSAERIEAIQKVGRGVLAAKKSQPLSAAEDDRHLAQLRAAVDRRRAALFDPEQRVAISLAGRETAAQASSRVEFARAAEQSRTDAAKLAAAARQRAAAVADALDRQPSSPSAALALQRARLIDRLAVRLEEVLADNGPQQLQELLNLRTRLEQTKGALTAAPVEPATPTLQARPSGKR